jgi:hypothetical protein
MTANSRQYRTIHGIASRQVCSSPSKWHVEETCSNARLLSLAHLAIQGKTQAPKTNQPMAYTTSVRAFRDLTHQDPLVDSYRLLVAIELALKGAALSPVGGHDVPMMLSDAANAFVAATMPLASGQLLSLSAQLGNDLVQVTCNGLNGQPSPVPAKSYPHLRYGRRTGDWAGVSETPGTVLGDLESTCHLICKFLIAHGAKIGVHL